MYCFTFSTYELHMDVIIPYIFLCDSIYSPEIFFRSSVYDVNPCC